MDKMTLRYDDYTVEDFVLDKDFRRWVLQPDRNSNLFWEKWISEHQSRVGDLRKARHILLSMSRIRYKAQAAEVSEVWKKISASVTEAEESDSTVIPLGPVSILDNYSSGRTKTRHLPYLQVAASIALVIVAFFLFDSLDPISSQKMAEQESTVKTNPRGQKSMVFLPDGTKVHLNSESELIYHADYNQTDRTVHLKGEAFFEVAKDSLRPFTVITSSLNTTALGTSFNVHAYPGKPVEISLMSGRVKVESNESRALSAYLEPGELATVSSTGELIKSNFERGEKALWRYQILSFDGTAITDALSIMERWYNVKFEVIGLKPELECTGKFEDEYLSNVLTSLGYTLGFSYKIEGKNIIIDFTK